LQDYGGSPTLFGVASVINHISEIFAYFFSFRLIKQIGHVKVRLFSCLSDWSLTHTHTHSLTQCSRVLLEKLRVQLDMKFPALCGTWMSITVFTRVHSRWIQSMH